MKPQEPSATATSEGPPQLTPPPRRFGLLHHRGFRLLWIGETTSAAGTTVSRVALPLLAVLTLHVSTFEVSVLAAATWLPWLIVGLPAGAWVDRLPRRPLMLGCDTLSFLLLLSIPIAAWTGVLSFAQLLIVTLLVGGLSVFFQTAYQVFLTSIVQPADLAEGNAKLQGSESVAQVSGSSVAGLIAQALGAATCVAADAVSFLVSAICVFQIRTREKLTTKAERTTTLRREIADGLRFVCGDPYLRVIALFGAISNLALNGYNALLIVFLVRDVGLNAFGLGLTLTAMSMGGVFGAAVANRIARRFGTAHGLLLSQMCTAPIGLLIPLTRPGLRIGCSIAGGIAIGIGVVSGNVLKSSFRQVYTPRELLGRVGVSMQFINYGGIPIGALLGGALATSMGLRNTLWIMLGGLSLATLVLLIGPIKSSRDLPLSAQPR